MSKKEWKPSAEWKKEVDKYQSDWKSSPVFDEKDVPEYKKWETMYAAYKVQRDAAIAASSSYMTQTNKDKIGKIQSGLLKIYDKGWNFYEKKGSDGQFSVRNALNVKDAMDTLGDDWKDKWYYVLPPDVYQVIMEQKIERPAVAASDPSGAAEDKKDAPAPAPSGPTDEDKKYANNIKTLVGELEGLKTTAETKRVEVIGEAKVAEKAYGEATAFADTIDTIPAGPTAGATAHNVFADMDGKVSFVQSAYKTAITAATAAAAAADDADTKLTQVRTAIGLITFPKLKSDQAGGLAKAEEYAAAARKAATGADGATDNAAAIKNKYLDPITTRRAIAEAKASALFIVPATAPSAPSTPTTVPPSAPPAPASPPPAPSTPAPAPAKPLPAGFNAWIADLPVVQSASGWPTAAMIRERQDKALLMFYAADEHADGSFWFGYREPMALQLQINGILRVLDQLHENPSSLATVAVNIPSLFRNKEVKTIKYPGQSDWKSSNSNFCSRVWYIANSGWKEFPWKTLATIDIDELAKMVPQQVVDVYNAICKKDDDGYLTMSDPKGFESILATAAGLSYSPPSITTTTTTTTTTKNQWERWRDDFLAGTARDATGAPVPGPFPGAGWKGLSLASAWGSDAVVQEFKDMSKLLGDFESKHGTTLVQNLVDQWNKIKAKSGPVAVQQNIRNFSQYGIEPDVWDKMQREYAARRKAFRDGWILNGSGSNHAWHDANGALDQYRALNTLIDQYELNPSSLASMTNALVIAFADVWDRGLTDVNSHAITRMNTTDWKNYTTNALPDGLYQALQPQIVGETISRKTLRDAAAAAASKTPGLVTPLPAPVSLPPPASTSSSAPPAVMPATNPFISTAAPKWTSADATTLGSTAVGTDGKLYRLVLDPMDPNGVNKYYVSVSGGSATALGLSVSSAPMGKFATVNCGNEFMPRGFCLFGLIARALDKHYQPLKEYGRWSDKVIRHLIAREMRHLSRTEFAQFLNSGELFSPTLKKEYEDLLKSTQGKEASRRAAEDLAAYPSAQEITEYSTGMRTMGPLARAKYVDQMTEMANSADVGEWTLELLCDSLHERSSIRVGFLIMNEEKVAPSGTGAGVVAASELDMKAIAPFRVVPEMDDNIRERETIALVHNIASTDKMQQFWRLVAWHGDFVRPLGIIAKKLKHAGVNVEALSRTMYAYAGSDARKSQLEDLSRIISSAAGRRMMAGGGSRRSGSYGGSRRSRSRSGSRKGSKKKGSDKGSKKQGSKKGSGKGSKHKGSSRR